MKREKLKVFALFLFGMSGLTVSGFAQPKDANWWDINPIWQNTTRYTKTYVVNQNDINASDENPGTMERPFKTINKAAQVAMPGERVVIYGGIYREMVQPKRGGTAPDKMIAYEAAPGENVIVSGSKIIRTGWERRWVFSDVRPDTLKTYTWSKKVWITTLPDSFFEDGYFPLQLANIMPLEYALMPWAQQVKNIAPYNSPRGLLFQNGRRMIQLVDYGDLAKVPGSFWVDKDKKTLHIHPFDDRDPNASIFELGVKHHLFLPQSVGLNYIQLSGISFEHCANGFLRTSTGAVTALGGQHWIIENNTIREINSSGLEFGYYAFETGDPNAMNVPRLRTNTPGGMIVRNNTIHDCGTAGIRSFVVERSLIENNHIYNCGWQDAENYWEVAGIKMLEVHNSLIRGNHIHDIQGGNGIWLDWNNIHCRVTQNIIHDVQTIQGAIFVEASHYPNLLDNNFIWNIDGNGVYANDTDSLLVYHNLISNIKDNIVQSIVATDRSQNGRKLTAENNEVRNNIFIDGRPMRFSSNSNHSDYNLYVSSKEPNYFNIAAFQDAGMEKHGQFIRSVAGFLPAAQYFEWKPAIAVNKVPRVKELSYDFFNKRREEALTFPGPFTDLPSGGLFLNEYSADRKK